MILYQVLSEKPLTHLLWMATYFYAAIPVWRLLVTTVPFSMDGNQIRFPFLYSHDPDRLKFKRYWITNWRPKGPHLFSLVFFFNTETVLIVYNLFYLFTRVLLKQTLHTYHVTHL